MIAESLVKRASKGDEGAIAELGTLIEGSVLALYPLAQWVVDRNIKTNLVEPDLADRNILVTNVARQIGNKGFDHEQTIGFEVGGNVGETTHLGFQ